MLREISGILTQSRIFGAKYLADADLGMEPGKFGKIKVGANDLSDVKIRPIKMRSVSREAAPCLIMTAQLCSVLPDFLLLPASVFRV